eukprot:scaffold44180_cov54-Phaeocystis_antarctica.AAC.2
MRMLSEEDEFYKDPDHMTTSESEGEEESSVMLDDGMNDLDAVKVKFAKFDEEKEVRDRTQLERRQLREATRDAVRLAELRGLTLTLALTLTLTPALTLTTNPYQVRFAELRGRDLRFGRPSRPLTAEEEELIAGAPTLRARLKESNQP